jgi:hypothetical protein
MQTDEDLYSEFAIALTDLLTERDRFLERRLRVAAARAHLDKCDARYWQAIEDALSILDSPDLMTL